ncbi:tRNA 2-thiouridine(34) synthase MnmA [Elusimicrobiota bacterium]
MENNKTIAVAVSGGVDSGVALYLLKSNGYNVVAVFVDHFGCESGSNPQSCCGVYSEGRARENAVRLDVPFYRFDYRKLFNEQVIKPFIEYYKNGLTPNPCVWCNAKIRFYALFYKIRSMGIGYLATGHYAITKDGCLFSAVDSKKDQSYFLYAVSPKVLEHVIFPLGDIEKKQVRKIADLNLLPVADTKESQDCCLLQDKNLKSFLRKWIPDKEGDIRDMGGAVIGVHSGAHLYTIGQRLRIGGLDGRFYVAGIDVGENRIIAGSDEDLYKKDVRIKIIDPEFFEVNVNEKLHVKLRYRQPAAACIIRELDFTGNICKITLETPQRSPTPGQSAVLYRGNKIVGGGEIER